MDKHAVLSEAKKKYGEVFEIKYSDGFCYVRPLTLFEYDTASKMDPVDAEDFMVEAAVIWPKDFSPLAGEISSIAQAILEVTGLLALEDAQNLLDRKRQEVQEVKSTMYAYVMATQDYTVEQLQELTFPQLVYRVALSEKIMQIQDAAFDPSVMLTFDILPTEDEPDHVEDMDSQFEEFAKAQKGYYANPDNPSTFGTATFDDPIAQQLRQALG